MAYKMSFSGFKRYRKSILRFVKDKDDQVEHALKKISSLILNDAKKLAPVQSGALRASGRIDEINKKEYHVRFGGMGTGVDYATFVEFGRSPGRAPPINELRTWSARALGNENAAGAIARTISRRGVRPQPFLRPAIKINERHLLSLSRGNIQKAWRKTVSRHNRK